MLNFLILAEPRSGTHLLKGLIGQHPELYCAGELFDPDAIHSKHYNVRRRIMEEAWRPGFKCGAIAHVTNGDFNHTDLSQHRWASMWRPDGLPGSVDKVIVLQRRDRFARLISEQTAVRRGKWQHKLGDKVEDIEPFEIDIAAARKRFRHLAELWIQKLELFKHLPRLNVTYEALTTAGDWELSRVFSFLGVPLCLPAPTELKVGKPPEKQITNYDEFVQKCARL